MVDLSDPYIVAPVFIVNSINFGRIAYNNFKQYREGGGTLLPALYWSLVSFSAVGVAEKSLGLENLLK